MAKYINSPAQACKGTILASTGDTGLTASEFERASTHQTALLPGTFHASLLLNISFANRRLQSSPFSPSYEASEGDFGSPNRLGIISSNWERQLLFLENIKLNIAARWAIFHWCSEILWWKWNAKLSIRFRNGRQPGGSWKPWEQAEMVHWIRSIKDRRLPLRTFSKPLFLKNQLKFYI